MIWHQTLNLIVKITKWKSCSHQNLDTYPQKGIILNQESKLLKFWIRQFFAMAFKYQYWKFQPRRLKLDGYMAQNLWSINLEKGTGDWEISVLVYDSIVF